jgi:aspartate carbamoyltransferase catalytic subunit
LEFKNIILKFPQHLLGIKYLDIKDMESLFDIADFYMEKIISKVSFEKSLPFGYSGCKGKTVINLFLENSTRTRISFDLAEKKMGMDVVNFTSSSSSLTKGESFLDTIKNIEAMKFDYIVVRHNVPGIPVLLTKYTTSKIINAGDGTNEHPTQALLDIYTLRQKFGKLKGLNVCIVGDISHSRVALSDIFGLLRFDVNVSVCGPVSFIPKFIEGLGVKVYYDLEDAIKDNDALILLRVQLEREAGYLLPSLNEYNKYFGLNESKLSLNPDLTILHPGPMNINVEIDYDVSVSKNSLIFDQVTNGVAIKCGIFNLMGKPG